MKNKTIHWNVVRDTARARKDNLQETSNWNEGTFAQPAYKVSIK